MYYLTKQSMCVWRLTEINTLYSIGTNRIHSIIHLFVLTLIKSHPQTNINLLDTALGFNSRIYFRAVFSMFS